MFDPSRLDLEEIAVALSSQAYGEGQWFIDPGSGEIAYWTEESGFDGEPVDLDDVELTPIDPLPSYIWYEDMVDFVDGITDERAARRLERAIRGKGAFRRFKDELEDYPELREAWYALKNVRARRRAVEFLREAGLVDDEVAQRVIEADPDPELP